MTLNTTPYEGGQHVCHKPTACLEWKLSSEIGLYVLQFLRGVSKCAKCWDGNERKNYLKCSCIEGHNKNWDLMFWKSDHEEYNAFRQLLLYKTHPEF